MNFYPIIILSNNTYTINDLYLQIKTPVKLENQTTIIFNNIEYSFDYLIFDDVNLITNFYSTNILHENRIPITNFYKATSIENIFYSNDIINTINDIENDEI